MASQTSSLIRSLHAHLQHVDRDPTQPLDERLLDECGIFLPPYLEGSLEENARIVGQISTLSPKLQQDPTSLIRLLQKLVTPFSFSDILALEPPVEFAGGLHPDALPFNRIMLQLLRKATATPSDRVTLANMQPVVKALVYLWLVTPDVGVAEDAASTLLMLLEADRERNNVAVHGIGEGLRASGGQGLIWRRIFDDRDIYHLIYLACGPEMQRKERSLAQARLMALAPKIGQLDWSYLVKSHHPDVEKKYGLDPSREGLLDFVAARMVDVQNDVLLHVNLIHMYRELITLVKLPSSEKNVSVSLHFLHERGLHERTVSYWLSPDHSAYDFIELSFLYGPSAQYISAFASECPDAFLQGSSHVNVVQRLLKALSRSATQWTQGQSPKHDLNVLVSLPRVCLLPQTMYGIGRQSSPLLLIPSKNTNADALNSLASVFGGPPPTVTQTATSQGEMIDDSQPSGISDRTKAEAAAARALYALYYSYNDSLFANLVDHANIVALPDKSLAALNLISSLANAEWDDLPIENRYIESAIPTSTALLPSEDKLKSLLPAAARPADIVARSGIEALLQSPTREHVFPFLLRPAQVFAHLVGGRGDPESNAYKIAMGKWDCLLLVHKQLHQRVSEGRGDDQAKMLLSATSDRVREGAWGDQSQAGGHVASLDL